MIYLKIIAGISDTSEALFLCLLPRRRRWNCTPAKVNRRLATLAPSHPDHRRLACLLSHSFKIYFCSAATSKVFWAVLACLKTCNSVWYCNWLVKMGHVGCLVLSSLLCLLLQVWWRLLVHGYCLVQGIAGIVIVEGDTTGMGHAHWLVLRKPLIPSSTACHPLFLYFALLA